MERSVGFRRELPDSFALIGSLAGAFKIRKNLQAANASGKDLHMSRSSLTGRPPAVPCCDSRCPKLCNRDERKPSLMGRRASPTARCADANTSAIAVTQRTSSHFHLGTHSHAEPSKTKEHVHR
jgi:hypothetical protein